MTKQSMGALHPCHLKDVKNFTFLGKIGEGALGCVYQALHNASQTIYAIKVM